MWPAAASPSAALYLLDTRTALPDTWSVCEETRTAAFAVPASPDSLPDLRVRECEDTHRRPFRRHRSLVTMFDHWTSLKCLEDGPSTRRQTPPRRSPPRGPRLNMSNYNYPEEFELGRFERVRQLHSEVLRYYRKIGNQMDEVSHAKEYCEFYGPCYFMADYYDEQLKDAEEALLKSLSHVKYLLSELDAIGVPYHIPYQLKDKIKFKQYVRPGTLAHLPGENFYHSEILENVPNVRGNQKNLLKQMSFNVNRIIFLQELGKDFHDTVCETYAYAGLYKRLRTNYKELENRNFNMDFQPTRALINRVRQILSKEPERVRAEREEEEEALEVPDAVAQGEEALEVPDAVALGEEEDVEEVEVLQGGEGEGEEGGEWEGEGDFQVNSEWEGHYVRFDYSSDE